MVEKSQQSDIQNDKTELRRQNGVEFDLSPLTLRDNYFQTIHSLNGRIKRFTEANWQGGIDPRLNFFDVRDLITDLYIGEVSSHLLPANSKLAIAQAFEVV